MPVPCAAHHCCTFPPSPTFRCREEEAAASSTADDLRQQLQALSAENRVLQETIRGMRQECTERWVRFECAGTETLDWLPCMRAGVEQEYT